MFYDQSAWDAAVATDKTALLPGIKAGFSNYTSYIRGLNGVIVDIQDLPGDPSASDFAFKVGNSSDVANWVAGPPPALVTVRRGAGTGGSDRVSLFWGADAVKKRWLQVRVRATAATGLANDDVFYFGNAVGECGNRAGLDAVVNATDEIQARLNPRSLFSAAPIDFPHDFNRDKQVNATDQIAARLNTTSAFTALQLITPSLDAGPSLASSPSEVFPTPNSMQLQSSLFLSSDQASRLGRFPVSRLGGAPSGASKVRLAVRSVGEGQLLLLAEGIDCELVRLEVYEEGEGWIEAPLYAEPVGDFLPAWSIDTSLWGESRLFRLVDKSIVGR